MKKNWRKIVPFAILAGLAGVAAFSGIVMLLWNGVLHTVLNIGTITFLQAAGILLLSKILFGGFRGGRRFAGGCGPRGGRWNKWNNLSDEERARCYHVKFSAASGTPANE